MQAHHRLTFISNRYRARGLRLFRAQVVDYFERIQRDADDLPFDWEGAQAARARINQMLPRILQVVRAAGLGARGARSPADTDPGPAIGRPEVLERIFSASYAEGMEQEVLDLLDMALGVYDGDALAALGRTINPLHHAGTLLRFLARGPRRLVRALTPGRSTSQEALQAEMARLEELASRLGEVEDVIEARFAMLQERQVARQAEQVRQVSELAERLDFAERLLARPSREASAPRESRSTTPV